MEKEFVPYELAIQLKELGFNENCLCVYNAYEQLKGVIVSSMDGDYVKLDRWDDRLPAPLYQQAFRFFREKYSYSSCVEYDNEINAYGFKFVYMNNGYYISEYIYTPEEAEIACLRKLIEVVKEQNKTKID